MATISLSTPGDGFFEQAESRTILEREVLPHYIPGCRWFGGKAREPRSFAVEEILPVGPENARIVLVRAEYADGSAETYQLPLEVIRAADEGQSIASFKDGAILRDALHSAEFRAALLHTLAENGRQAGARGILQGERGQALPGGLKGGVPSRVLAVEQSNSSLNYNEQLFVKLFRKLEDGLNPDVEITRFLSDRRGFTHVPPYAGALSYTRDGREPQVLALALGLVEHQGDAWTQALAAVGQFLALVRDLEDLPEHAAHSPALLATAEDSSALREMAGPFTDRVERLGIRTAETHLALATEPHDPAFAPEPFTAADQRALSEAVTNSAKQMFTHLRGRPDEPLAAELLANEAQILALAARIGEHEVATAKIRTHGDYHLGQVLSQGDDFVLLDFEGEPQRSLAERKQKRSPLRDVAGMLRSFHYAAHSGLNEFPAHRALLTPWAEAWSSLMSRTFLRGWLETAAGSCFLPAKLEDVGLLLHAFLLEKAIYEVGYELNNRPTWLGIPLRGILAIAKSEAT